MAQTYEIKKIIAREILDSRGNPTVEVEISTDNNTVLAKVPSGASTGVHEALELRDGDKNRFHGKGVLNAVKNVNDIIAGKIIGLDCRNQKELDNLMIELDGTENKTNLGANAILGVSMGACRLAATEQKIGLYEHIAKISGNKNDLFSLPTPAMNIINGGEHAGNDLDVQEYMIIPIGGKNFSEKVRICSEIYHSLKDLLKEKYGKNAINVGDEGGFAPPLNKVEEPLYLMTEVIDKLDYSDKVKIGIDCAASGFYDEEKKKYVVEEESLKPEELSDLYNKLIATYPIISIEDPFSEDDWDSWVNFNSTAGKKIKIIGDDILVTNINRINKAIEEKACNSLLLKINQIGTITEAISAFSLAKNANWSVMVSHRSGETDDCFISDLVVGLGGEFIKSGAPCRGERTTKYNQLLRIEERCSI